MKQRGTIMVQLLAFEEVVKKDAVIWIIGQPDENN